ncbi:hypothetical protein [Okeania sp. SIO2B3]|uniref:hypothetical protein n=1 Tax=Okeania sp. SIO2B3 TaxID=2607784 RepID=UPI0013BEE293|nr:hypothetical protein [Okeania sp. SIO2B3]NET44484.1 hypothetical protein [Okeania sp. SIO2B3]
MAMIIDSEKMTNNFYFERGEQLKDQGKIEEALNAYQKSINLTSISDAQYIRKVIYQAASIATINQPPYKKIIFYAGIGGLCNRLRALCAYLCLSYFWDIPLLMCWHPEEACNCYFEDLYETVCETISPQSVLQLFRNEDSCNILYVTEHKWPSIHQRYLEGNIDNETYRKHYLKFVRQMKLKNHLLQEIEKFVEKYWHNDIVGIHIRRTDLWKHLKSRGLESKFSSDDKFIKAIKKEISNGYSRFFLATDNAATKSLISKQFPEQIISYCQTFDDSQKRQTSTENSLIDLYLLSKSQKIIGSYHSSFSEYAAALGNIPLVYP